MNFFRPSPPKNRSTEDAQPLLSRASTSETTAPKRCLVAAPTFNILGYRIICTPLAKTQEQNSKTKYQMSLIKQLTSLGPSTSAAPQTSHLYISETLMRELSRQKNPAVPLTNEERLARVMPELDKVLKLKQTIDGCLNEITKNNNVYLKNFDSPKNIEAHQKTNKTILDININYLGRLICLLLNASDVTQALTNNLISNHDKTDQMYQAKLEQENAKLETSSAVALALFLTPLGAPAIAANAINQRLTRNRKKEAQCSQTKTSQNHSAVWKSLFNMLIKELHDLGVNKQDKGVEQMNALIECSKLFDLTLDDETAAKISPRLEQQPGGSKNMLLD